jgi:hypothetical protein
VNDLQKWLPGRRARCAAVHVSAHFCKVESGLNLLLGNAGFNSGLGSVLRVDLARVLLRVPHALDANVARQAGRPALEVVAVAGNIGQSVALQNAWKNPRNKFRLKAEWNKKELYTLLISIVYTYNTFVIYKNHSIMVYVFHQNVFECSFSVWIVIWFYQPKM